MVDLLELSTVAHHMEDLLKELQGGGRELSPAIIDLLLVATDAIEALLAQASAGGALSVNVAPILEALQAGALPEQTGEPARPRSGGCRTTPIGPGQRRTSRPVDQLHGGDPPQPPGTRRAAAPVAASAPGNGHVSGPLHQAENYRLMKEMRSSS